MVLLAVAFAGWIVFELGMDITGQSPGAGVNELGSVNGQPITYAAYQAAYQELYQNAQQQLGGQVSREQQRAGGRSMEPRGDRGSACSRNGATRDTCDGCGDPHGRSYQCAPVAGAAGDLPDRGTLRSREVPAVSGRPHGRQCPAAPAGRLLSRRGPQEQALPPGNRWVVRIGGGALARVA